MPRAYSTRAFRTDAMASIPKKESAAAGLQTLADSGVRC